MFRFALPFALLAAPAFACETPVCQVDPNTLALPRVITFEDQSATMGPGHLINDPWVLPGVVLAERFVGQTLGYTGDFDTVRGPAKNPLTPQAGLPGQTMSLVMMSGNKVLNGYGRAAFPSRDGQGEGAISILFDEDQAALAFDIRGGEGGRARVMFLRRDGSVITTLRVQRLHEYAVGFERNNGVVDIAGVIIMNDDPQGLALDNLRFGNINILG
ncbi:hypothetical protein [Ascidiaceihabitans sp.]|uniref:hypothetical protein n=1 Tax=Ascidiaceihabitans sp. TaxID=1872644 RepID=UPI0032992032